MQSKNTREPQYQRCLDVQEEIGHQALGLMTNHLWLDDPRHLLFSLSRYKFVAKMFSGQNNVLEIGCGDAFGSRVVQQEVTSLTAVDFDPVFVADVNQRMQVEWKFTCFQHDMLSGPVPGGFDAAYSLDVLEHIQTESEDVFLSNLCASLNPEGVAIVGSPSLESQTYASVYSKMGHVNCKTQKDLKATLSRHFHNVFMFSMNDEVLHTGYAPMSHYLFGLCTGPKVLDS